MALAVATVLSGCLLVLSLVREMARADRLRKTAEAAQARLEDALESAPDGIAIYDAEGRLVIGNSRVLALHPEVVEAIGPGTAGMGPSGATALPAAAAETTGARSEER